MIWILTFILGLIWCQLISHFGASILLHRHYSHRTIKKVPVWFEIVAMFGLMIAYIRTPIGWIASHRMHHLDSDGPTDPHSPARKGFWPVLFTIWDVPKIPIKHARDLYANPILVFYHAHWLKIIFAVWIISYSIDVLKGNALSPYFFVGFALMPFIFSKIGFGLLNTVGHGVSGPNQISKGPSNVPWINFFISGEGWHKIHHEHPGQLRLHKYDTGGYIAEKLFT